MLIVSVHLTEDWHSHLGAGSTSNALWWAKQSENVHAMPLTRKATRV